MGCAVRRSQHKFVELGEKKKGDWEGEEKEMRNYKKGGWLYS